MNDIVIEILGSGGASTIPRALCKCQICEEARQKGYPYKRTGPSVFIHGPNILIDTPEESADQVERAKLQKIDAGFYSHWHPDHTAGSRLWEALNKNHRNSTERFARTTPIYLPENVIKTFEEHNGLKDHFDYYDKIGFTKTHIAPLGEEITFDGMTMTPFQMFEDFVTGFELRSKNTKAMIIMDETIGWHPTADQIGWDLVIMPIGVVEFHPLTGERIIREGHGILKGELAYAKVLDLVKELKAKRVILSHIGEGDQLSYDELVQIQSDLQKQGLPVEFAYDGMKITV